MNRDPEPGSFEHAYEYDMTGEERAQYDREQQAEEAARAKASACRLDDLERRWNQVGADIFGRPLPEPEPEPGDPEP